MWDLIDQKSKPRRKPSNWPEVGPLGRDIDHVFSNLVYRDTSSPLSLTIWCDSDTIIILATIYGLSLNEVDITVADQALLLKIIPDIAEVEANIPGQVQNENMPSYTIPLLYQVAVSQIEAGLDNDFLYIKLPRLKENMTEENTIEYLQ